MSRAAKTGLIVALLAALLPSLADAQVPDPQYLEAKRWFEGIDYDNAVRAFDQVIGGLLGRPVQDPGRRAFLPSALEMRGRAKFGLADQDGAKADFVSLLKINPAYTVNAQVSPRVISLFDEAVKEATTTFDLSVTPASARIELDGLPVTPASAMPIAVGEHVLTVDRPGYRRVQQVLLAEAGKPGAASIALERIASLLTIFAVPADVDVIIDGVRRGRMAAGPPAPEYADAIARAGVPPAQAAAIMVVGDLQPGSHVVELSRDCYVRAERRITIERPDDYSVGLVTLDHAVASLTVRASELNAQFLIDGQGRGGAPFATELCEGEHTVELRTPAGRYFKRVQARTGERIALDATIKPALALVSVAGPTAGGPDLRLVVERTFDALRGTTLFAPPADQAEQALKASQLTAGWLAFDANRRPVDTAADMVPAVRREASTKLAAAFNAQGVATITVVGRNRIVLSLLANGSGLPDVVAVSLDAPDSITAAMAQLDGAPSLFRPSIGLVAIDVADVAGAVVASVDASGSANGAGIRPGHIITKANGQPVNDAAGFATALAARKADEALSIEVKDRTGAAKSVEAKVILMPQLVGVADQTLPANRTLLALRARLLTAQNTAAEEAVVRLNLGATLVRLEAWSDARTELQRVNLPDGPGVANGTVQYLLGLCAERLGDLAEAEKALKAAAASDSLLTEYGPPVKDLAEARLAGLRRPR